jgi:hypothetical protein
LSSLLDLRAMHCLIIAASEVGRREPGDRAMLSLMHKRDQIQQAKQSFAADTKSHELTIELDEGLHRHLKVRNPETGFGWYEIVTWPGSLTISGDMGTFTFSRTDDMLGFFGEGKINPRYWMEKLGAPSWDAREALATQFTEESLTEWIQWWRDQVIKDDLTDNEGSLDAAAAAAFTEAVEEQLLSRTDSVEDEREARSLLSSFEFDWKQPEIDWKDPEAGQGGLVGDATISLGDDLYETDLREWRHQYLWCCLAICHAVKLYRAQTATVSAPWHKRVYAAARRVLSPSKDPQAKTV